MPISHIPFDRFLKALYGQQLPDDKMAEAFINYLATTNIGTDAFSRRDIFQQCIKMGVTPEYLEDWGCNMTVLAVWLNDPTYQMESMQECHLIGYSLECIAALHGLTVLPLPWHIVETPSYDTAVRLQQDGQPKAPVPRPVTAPVKSNRPALRLVAGSDKPEGPQG